MKVVWATAYGPPEVLVAGTAPDPIPTPGHVVVDVQAAALTFVDTQIRSGTDKWHAAPEVPYIPGGVIAGRVTSLGLGVSRDWMGCQVLADTHGRGGLAENVLLPASSLVRIPAGVGPLEAAALFTDGTTAIGLMEGAGIQPRDWVLVEAAAGGVGTLLVQLARSAGARVVGAARGADKLEFIARLGADAVVDYSEPDWTETVRRLAGGAGPTVVFDGVGGELGRMAFELTAPGGRFSIHGASSGSVTHADPDEARARGIQLLPIEQLFAFPARQDELLKRIFAAVLAGRVRPVIGQTFPLADASRAHAAIESRATIGKTLLTIGDSGVLRETSATA